MTYACITYVSFWHVYVLYMILYSKVLSGGHKTNIYHNKIIFKGNIEATDREIRIKIKKKEPDWWPRLLFDSKDCQDFIINK